MLKGTKGNHLNNIPAAPEGSNTVNPFIMADNAAALIDFLVGVLGAKDVADARSTPTA